MRICLLLVMAGTLLVTAHAGAEQACVDIATVQVSSLPTHNTEYGGHLTAHIYGLTPPPGDTQFNKTLFTNSEDYFEAWNDLRSQEPQIKCADHPQLGAEAARDTDTRLFSRQCTAANGNGVCTAYNEVQTHLVVFVFRAVNLDNRVRWILYTAYPRKR